MPSIPNLLRSRNGHADSKVSFVELFFDLVFVFAITQLAHTLIEHFTPLGAIQAFMLLVAVWLVWIYTTWVTNWLDPEKIPVRIGLFVMMGLGLVLSASLPHSFSDRAIPFAISFAAMQTLRPLFFIWAVRGEPTHVANFKRILAWAAVPGALWIFGATQAPDARIFTWAAALLIELAGPIFSFYVPVLGKSSTTDWNVSGEHMAERCGLFIIIALGESILVTGNTFSKLDWNGPTISAFAIAIVGSILMWWIYFDDSAASGADVIEHSDDPGRIARLSYTYLHFIIVAGIVVAAAADEYVLHHPTGATDTKTAIAILTSNAIFLLGNLLFKATVYRVWAISHMAGMAALVALASVVSLLTPVGLMGAAVAVLAVVAVWEHLACQASGTPHGIDIEG